VDLSCGFQRVRALELARDLRVLDGGCGGERAHRALGGSHEDDFFDAQLGELVGRGLHLLGGVRLVGVVVDQGPLVFPGHLLGEGQPVAEVSVGLVGEDYAPRSALEAALSPGRASVLKGCLTPRTTTDLARELGLSPAAVSAHLSRLKVAGLIERHRSGRKVFYRLGDAGESLLEIFGES